MNLEDIKTKQQMQEALAAGDEQLLADIREAVKDEATRQADDWGNASVDTEFFDIEEEASNLLASDFDPLEVIQAFIYEDLYERLTKLVPNMMIASEFREEIAKMSQRGYRGFLSFEEEDRSTFGYRVRETMIEFRVGDFDEPLSWVPEDIVEEILNDEVQPYGEQADWENMGGGMWTSGWIPRGVDLLLVADRNGADEWAYDLIRDYLSEMIDAEPDVAVAAYENYLAREYPDLFKKLKKLKLPLEVRASLALVFFEDQPCWLEALAETVGSFGYEGTRASVLLEIDRAALREIGITSGRWWDGAPWRLLDLPVEELSYEGAIMRHCVGRRDFGYREGVENEEIKIWSLRNAFNNPILTWEIDWPYWDSALDDRTRGDAISQLKGKVNRLAGKDADEVRVLHWIFAKLGVNPSMVQDFRPRASNPRSKKRVARSFCEPYQSGRRRNGPAATCRHQAPRAEHRVSNPSKLKRKLMPTKR